MIALPPRGVATDSVLATASPPAAVISRTTSSAGAASPPSPAKPPPESLTTTFAPCAASNRAYERPSPLPPPVMAATRSSNLKSLFSEDQAIQITPGTPFLQQVVECVEARHVRFADSGTNAFSSSAALIVVIARRAGDCEFGSVYGGFADRVDPVVLSFLARLDGRRVAFRRLGDDVGDVFGLLLEHRGRVPRHAALNEAGEELVGKAAAGHPVQ